MLPRFIFLIQFVVIGIMFKFNNIWFEQTRVRELKPIWEVKTTEGQG